MAPDAQGGTVAAFSPQNRPQGHPKPRKRATSEKGQYSDSHLMSLWRTAIQTRYPFGCAARNSYFEVKDRECQGTLEAHHIVRRGKGVLRHDWRNGIRLCVKHHRYVETMAGKEWLRKEVGARILNYLAEHDVILADYLVGAGLSRAEFSRLRARELKAVINGVRQ